jgi:hypothetical protein
MINKNELYIKCIDKWGVYPQLDVAVEEMAELIQAISKIKRLKKEPSALYKKDPLGDPTKTYEVMCKAVGELVDAEIMLEQTKMILVDLMGYDAEYDQARKDKLFKINSRVEKTV